VLFFLVIRFKEVGVDVAAFDDGVSFRGGVGLAGELCLEAFDDAEEPEGRVVEVLPELDEVEDSAVVDRGNDGAEVAGVVDEVGDEFEDEAPFGGGLLQEVRGGLEGDEGPGMGLRRAGLLRRERPPRPVRRLPSLRL